MNEKTQKSNLLVKAKNISLEFKLHEYRYDSLKEKFISLIKRKKNKKKIFRVLNNISFEIKKGESLGVIGHNGAGKSTLLKLVAGIYPPTSGTIETTKDVMLLNLGAGFNMEANAEENIYLNGALLGFSRKEIKNLFNSIIEFAELEEFIKMPLKNYSSGMISRLGFAIAINIHPELLLIDEVLAVGDANFRKKCMDKIKELKKQGISFMYVSHSISQVKELCEYTLWIENSEVKAYGPSNEVCKQYEDYCKGLSTSVSQQK
ncbi:MAG: ABC transporter ATP-binding protein [Clostridia bacterium]|nr:ABC transporter ATP-binding protein [Clostridia bacterium]